jgi:peptide/nickel transport system substrate-binding protein
MRKMLFAVVFLLLMAVPLMQIVAQEEIAPGEGGPIITGNSSGSTNLGPLNPLLCLGTDCSELTNQLFPSLIGISLDTFYFAPDAEGALATDWTVSEDGLTYTFTLRQDLFWSDGEQITSEDVLFSMDAILSEQLDSIYSTTLVDRIASVEAPDEFTFVITFTSARCTALSDSAIPVIPAHVFSEDFAEMNESEFNRNPSVSAGVWEFLAFEAGERVALQANQDYLWAENGVIPSGYLYLDMPDSTVEMERFFAGELNFISGVPTDFRQQVRESGEYQVFEFPANSWSYIGLNLADPSNPQNGLDEEGNRIDQGHHPLFGDVRVRRALQHAMDVQAIIDVGRFGEGNVMASYVLPTSWALDTELAPIPFDPELAGQLLDEAGFPMGDDGIRVAQGAEYAEDGTPFTFELITAEGSEATNRIGSLLVDQMANVGVEVIFSPMDFNTMVELSAGQTYDAYFLGWQNAFPDDPDPTNILGLEADVVGFGFNDVSYHNLEANELMEQALNVPGCAQEDRAQIYYELQRILQEDQPYLWMYTDNVMAAAQSNVENWNPLPNVLRANIYEWTVRSSN